MMTYCGISPSSFQLEHLSAHIPADQMPSILLFHLCINMAQKSLIRGFQFKSFTHWVKVYERIHGLGEVWFMETHPVSQNDRLMRQPHPAQDTCRNSHLSP